MEKRNVRVTSIQGVPGNAKARELYKTVVYCASVN